MRETITKFFTDSYEKHSDALFRYALFNVNDREKAMDLVQDAFAKTWNSMVKGEEIKNIKAFLYRILKNSIIDHYRSKKAGSLDQMQEDENFDPPAEDARIEDIIDSKIVFSMLNKIPKEYRDVIFMRCVEEMSFKEMGEVLKEKENALAVRFHRGIKKMRTMFDSPSHSENIEEKAYK